MTDDRDSSDDEPEPTDDTRLSHSLDPPSALVHRIVGALKEKSLLQPLSKPKPWWTWPRIGVAMATAVLLVIVGYQIGIRQTPSSPTASPTSMTFSLFLYMDQVAEPRLYPENTLKVYQEWGTNLQEKGVDLSGDRLMENGVLLFTKDKK